MPTKIEWTDETWNPVTGCTKVSEGCDHCYAETIAHRFTGTKAYPNGFDVTLRPERLDQPLRWKRPRKVFVNSMSDLFHKDVPDEYIARVFAIMDLAHWHTYQVLTKRPGRMRSLLSSAEFRHRVAHNADLEIESWSGGEREVTWPLKWPLPNVWLGTSVENQKWADVRIPLLLDTPAAIRFLSCEPLLGPIDLFAWNIDRGMRVDWVIVGGESGPHARPMHPDWARQLRDDCLTAGIPFHFKQWGEWVTEDQAPEDIILPGLSTYLLGDDEPDFYKVGKKAAGRELDGQTWDEYPGGLTDG